MIKAPFVAFYIKIWNMENNVKNVFEIQLWYWLKAIWNTVSVVVIDADQQQIETSVLLLAHSKTPHYIWPKSILTYFSELKNYDCYYII